MTDIKPLSSFSFLDYKQLDIIGGKGSGKTNLAAAKANEMTDFIFIDTLGVLHPKNEYRSARIPNTSYYGTPKNNNGDSVDMFFYAQSKTTIKRRHVIDFSEFITLEERQDAINRISLWILRESKRGNVYPLIVDEIADYAPEGKEPPEALHRLVKNGRNYGIYPVVLITQRPQSTSKQLLDLADCYVIGRQQGPRTIETIQKIADLDDDLLKNLQPRQFYISEEKGIYEAPYYRFSKKQ